MITSTTILPPNTLIAAVNERFRPNPLLLAKQPLGDASGYLSLAEARSALAHVTADPRSSAVIVADGDAFRGYELVALRGGEIKPWGISGREMTYTWRHPDVLGIVDGGLFVPAQQTPR